MNMSGSINRMQQMNEKLDKAIETVKETNSHVEQLMEILKQLIGERVEAGKYVDLLTHPNVAVRSITQEQIKAHEQKIQMSGM